MKTVILQSLSPEKRRFATPPISDGPLPLMEPRVATVFRG